MSGLKLLGRRRDAGAASTIVAILLAGGVLMGMTALVVDVGRLYAEREQLQSGADSAAMTVAIDCAKHRAACVVGGDIGGAELASDANARDGRSKVVELCGFDRGGPGGISRLPACTIPDAGNLADCIGTPPPGVSFVQVRTHTEVATDNYVLPFSVAQTLASTGSGATVGACARVAYSPPQTGLALTISRCEYERAIAASGEVAAPPWPPDPAASAEVALGVHGPVAVCGDGPPSGFNMPGGFGWLDPAPGGGCTFALEADLEYGGETGTPPSTECKAQLAALRASHQVVVLPIYDGERGTGANAEYHLYKLAAFVVTGYSLPGLKEESNVHPSFDPCGGSDKCVYGYFLNVDFLPGDLGSVDPGVDLGLSIIKTIG
jgi:hypothetical protein